MLQVFALKYGERQTTACQFFFREASHEPVTLHFFVWLILGGPLAVPGRRVLDPEGGDRVLDGAGRAL